MIKSGLFISVGNVFTALLGLIRNVLIARLLSVDDFGIASTFAITFALIEMTSNIAIDRLIVQSKQGDDPALQSTLQSMQVLRGLLGGLILFLLAGPIAQLFGLPEIAWAYQVLALVPVIRGLAHLDMFRQQRNMVFRPIVFTELLSQGLSTLLVIPLALWLNDYRAMLYAIIIQQAAYFTISHLVAERKYLLSWNSAFVTTSLSFGWPLLLNGLLMFGIFQGDRIIVGSLIGITELGWFSAAFTLTLAPTLVLGKTLNSYYLPQLSKARDDQKKLHNLSLVIIEAGLLCGILLAGFFVVVGPYFFIFLFGQKYSAAISILVWLSIMQAVRVAKAGPAIVAISNADTKNPLIANILRVAMLPVAWQIVSETQSILWAIWIAILGEVLAVIVSLLLLHRDDSINLKKLLAPLATCVIILGYLGLDTFLFAGEGLELRIEQLAISGLLLLLVLWSMPALRHWVVQLKK